MKLSYDSIVKLHPLNIRQEKKNYIVEDQVTGEFYEMPEVCIAAIEMINKGIYLKEIERELIEKYPHEVVDLLAFVSQLIDMEMVEEIDGTYVEVKNQKQENLGFTKIDPIIGKLFFNKSTKIIYAFIFVVNLIMFFLNPHLFPHYKDIFIFDVMFQNILLWVVVGLILAIIHEIGHILSIRAFNLPTNLTFGHRLFFLVLETDMSLGWKLPVKDRMSIYLAGVCFDNVLLFLALTMQLFFPNSSGLFLSIMALIVFEIATRFIYQCCVYMKTDFYYVLENLTGTHNLMENAKAWIFKRRETLIMFEGEKRTIYLYTVFYFLGITITIAMFIFYYLPQLVYTILTISPGFREPIGSIPFLDALFILLQGIIVIGLLVRSWWRTYSKRI
jgi:putative peptide zinc metalloprotease protein